MKIRLTVVRVKWFLCTARLTFWKLEKVSKLKDRTDLDDTEEPEDTEDTPERRIQKIQTKKKIAMQRLEILLRQNFFMKNFFLSNIAS